MVFELYFNGTVGLEQLVKTYTFQFTDLVNKNAAKKSQQNKKTRLHSMSSHIKVQPHEKILEVWTVQCKLQSSVIVISNSSFEMTITLQENQLAQ